MTTPRDFSPAGRLSLVLACLLVVFGLLACGKKGPPLPPLPESTPTVSDLALHQIGRVARASFTLPVRPDATEVDYVTLGVDLWRRPVEPPTTGGSGALPALGPAAAGRVPRPTDFTDEATRVATVEGEQLFDALLTERVQLDDALPAETPEEGYEYAVVLRTNQRRRGTLSNTVTFVPVPPPPVPQGLATKVEEGVIRLTWSAPETEVGGLAWRVFRAVGDAQFSESPLTREPVKQPTHADTTVTRGTSYRYRVIAIAGSGEAAAESEPSDDVLATYRDTFAPAVPEGLRLVPEGSHAVNLLWNPSPERDLAGYAVQRREGGGAWTRLDAGGARSATFSDTQVQAGHSYEYSVSAFDTAEPPNESSHCAPVSIDVIADP